MNKGNSGMGMHKHYVSGINPKSPKQRLFERMRAESSSLQRPSFEMYDSMEVLMREKCKKKGRKK